MQMMRNFLSVFAGLLTSAVLGLSFIGAAQAQSTDQILANPKVDDIYAARVDYFSDATFGDGGEAFGVLRVVEVTKKDVVVLTSETAWGSKKYAVEEIEGDFSETVWDESEKITIKRSELASLKREEMIFNVRRLTPKQISEYLD